MGRQRSHESARSKIRTFLDTLQVGDIFDADRLKQEAGIQEFARRLRELRQEEGYIIAGYRDIDGLKNSQYKFLGKQIVPPKPRPVKAAQVRVILAKRPYCQLCGRVDGSPEPDNPVRRVKLHVHHLRPQAREGTSDTNNLMVLCSFCNEGLRDETVLNAWIRADDLLPKLKAKGRDEKLHARLRLADWLLANPDL